jgi:hypothetical protein
MLTLNNVGDSTRILIYDYYLRTTVHTVCTTVVWSSSSRCYNCHSYMLSRRKKLNSTGLLQKQQESPLLFSQRDPGVAEDVFPKDLLRSRRTHALAVALPRWESRTLLRVDFGHADFPWRLDLAIFRESFLGSAKTEEHGTSVSMPLGSFRFEERKRPHDFPSQ